MHSVEVTWYKFLVLLTSIMGIAFGTVNLVYFNKIRVNNNCEEISSGTATTLLWLNLILIIFSTIIFLWSLYRLIFTGKTEEDLLDTTYKTHIHDYAEPADISEQPVIESTTTI